MKKEMQKELKTTKEKVDWILHALQGNGQKGLFGRIDEIERRIDRIERTIWMTAGGLGALMWLLSLFK